MSKITNDGSRINPVWNRMLYATVGVKGLIYYNITTLILTNIYPSLSLFLSLPDTHTVTFDTRLACDTAQQPTSAGVVSLEEVGDWLPVAADAYHDVAVDGTHEVRLFSLQFVAELQAHNDNFFHIVQLLMGVDHTVDRGTCPPLFKVRYFVNVPP